MSRQWPGGLIRRTPPTVVGGRGSAGSAKGVWTLEQATNQIKQGLWQTPGVVPGAPTIGTATAGDATATVPFTAPADNGGFAITGYTATSSPGSITGTAASSPITVAGLTNGTPYTFTVTATNYVGTGAASAASNSVTPAVPVRGLFAGSVSGGFSNVIQYINISATGNAIDFGDLTETTAYAAACASSTRALWALSSVGGNPRNLIAYVTIATTGNALSFGQLTQDRSRLSGVSNSTRGVWAGGFNADLGGRLTTMDYVTIASTGNALSFGSLAATSGNLDMASLASPTRGVFAGGEPSGSATNVIQYITIATTGSSVDFGDLLSAIYSAGGCSNNTRGLIGGAGTATNVIQYITIATTGNAIDFGDLTKVTGGFGYAACSSSERAVFSDCGSNVMSYVTIASTGNAIDFGDRLAVPSQISNMCGTSGGHGGL